MHVSRCSENPRRNRLDLIEPPVGGVGRYWTSHGWVRPHLDSLFLKLAPSSKDSPIDFSSFRIYSFFLISQHNLSPLIPPRTTYVCRKASTVFTVSVSDSPELPRLFIPLSPVLGPTQMKSLDCSDDQQDTYPLYIRLLHGKMDVIRFCCPSRAVQSGSLLVWCPPRAALESFAGVLLLIDIIYGAIMGAL